MALLTLIAFVVAAAAAATAWHLWQRERERSSARVAALAAAIDPPGEGATLFTPDRGALAPEHPLLKVTAGFVLVATALLVFALVTERRPAGPAATAAPQPSLALLSMRHDQSGATLTVTGLVRNEGPGGAEGVVATVLVFDAAGSFLASGRAPLDTRVLDDGEESPFRVSVPQVRGAARYRVSFRNDSGMVRHLDRRGRPEPAASPARGTGSLQAQQSARSDSVAPPGKVARQ